MGRLMGMALIMIGCAGVLGCWNRRERLRQALQEEWIRLFAGFEYAVLQEHVRLYEFFSCYETKFPQMKKFLMDVCDAMQTFQEPSGISIWMTQLQKHKNALLADAKTWEILTAAAEAFYADTGAENIRSMQVCRKRMEQCLATQRKEYAKKQRVYAPVGMMAGIIVIILLV